MGDVDPGRGCGLAQERHHVHAAPRGYAAVGEPRADAQRTDPKDDRRDSHDHGLHQAVPGGYDGAGEALVGPGGRHGAAGGELDPGAGHPGPRTGSQDEAAQAPRGQAGYRRAAHHRAATRGVRPESRRAREPGAAGGPEARPVVRPGRPAARVEASGRTRVPRRRSTRQEAGREHAFAARVHGVPGASVGGDEPRGCGGGIPTGGASTLGSTFHGSPRARSDSIQLDPRRVQRGYSTRGSCRVRRRGSGCRRGRAAPGADHPGADDHHAPGPGGGDGDDPADAADDAPRRGATRRVTAAAGARARRPPAADVPRRHAGERRDARVSGNAGVPDHAPGARRGRGTE